MKTSVRSFLNPYSIWGVKAFDPHNIEQIKQTSPNVVRSRYVAPARCSRYLSENPSTYSN